MPAVPIYVWNGTTWQETGPTIPASPIKYQASAPSSPSTGDIWVDSDGDVTTGSQQFQRFRFVASGGETTESGADANGAVLAYTPGAELVVLNGSTLVRGQDYTATNGTTITGLSPALVANDVLEVFSFIAFSVANTYTQSQVDGLITTLPMGLVKLSTTTFSSTGSVSLPTDTFTSTYKNYRLLFNLSASSTALTITARMRAAGTDATGTVYNQMTTGFTDTGSASNRAQNSQSSWTLEGTSTNAFFDMSLDILNPKVATYTKITGGLICDNNTNFIGKSIGLIHGANTAFDSMSFIASTGTFGGTITVYGYGA